MGLVAPREAGNSVDHVFPRIDPETGEMVDMPHINARQLARLLRVRESSIRDAVRLGTVPHYKHGPRRTPYFADFEVRAIVAAQEHPGLRVVDPDDPATLEPPPPRPKDPWGEGGRP